MTLIIDQLAKARQIWELFVKVPTDDESLLRWVYIAGLEQFEVACLQVNSHKRSCGRVPSNLNRWMKDFLYARRSDSTRREQ